MKTKDQKQIDRLKRALIVSVDALSFYAQPSCYIGIAIIPDRPCGSFANDASQVTGLNRKVPGRTARKAILKIARIL